MRWCTFVFFISLRCINYFLAHVTWIFYLYIGCAYFVLWKSFDILWLWIHLPLCLCLPKLRQDNIFITAVKLCVRKHRVPGKSAHELFKDLWVKERDKELDEDTEDPENHAKPDSSRLASAVSLGLFYLRFRVSIAILVGNIRRHSNDRISFFQDWSAVASVLFMFSLYTDLVSLWLLLQWSWVRQCRLCCQLGCCRYYLWMLLTVAIGAIVMEAPMSSAEYFYTDAAKCGFNVHEAINATKLAITGGG